MTNIFLVQFLLFSISFKAKSSVILIFHKKKKKKSYRQVQPGFQKSCDAFKNMLSEEKWKFK